MKRIAVIPARGGSKRIPKKNIIDFMGKPIMGWTIDAALESQAFERIILSTDDPEFAEIGRKLGLDVPFLRKEKNDDISPVSEATIEAIKQAESHYNEEYNIVVQLMANAPMRTSVDINRHLEEFEKNNRDFQISCFPFGWMNPWWSVKLDKEGTPEWMLPKGFNERSQDLEKLYCPTGVTWIAKVEELKKAGTFYGPNYKFCEIDWKSAVDIDDYEDLDFAKAIYLLKHSDG